MLSFLAQGSGLIDPQAQNLQLERFAGERVGGEWQELGAGQVLNGFGVAREGLELKDMPRQRSTLWQERGPLRDCAARVELTLVTGHSSGAVSQLWTAITTQESGVALSQNNFQKVTLD